jgi:hypothetical protein
MEKQTFKTKLYEACSSDELRPVLMCVHFKNGFAYASDAHMVVKQSLEYHAIQEPLFLEGKCIHKDNYKAIMGFEIATCNEDGVSCSDSDGRTAFYEYFDTKGVPPPNFDEVLKPTGCKSIEFIGINPDFVERIGKALHTPSGTLRFQFQGIDKGVLIDTPEIENQWAILMPVFINESLFGNSTE